MTGKLRPKPRRRQGSSGSAGNDLAFKPDASAEDVLDEGLRETFPASDPVSVQRTYRRKVRKAARRKSRR